MDRNCIVITCSNAQGSGAKGIRLLIHKIYFKESILDNLYLLYFAFPPFTKWWKTPTTNQENYSKDTGSNTVSFQKWLLTETAIKTKFTICISENIWSTQKPQIFVPVPITLLNKLNQEVLLKKQQDRYKILQNWQDKSVIKLCICYSLFQVWIQKH